MWRKDQDREDNHLLDHGGWVKKFWEINMESSDAGSYLVSSLSMHSTPHMKHCESAKHLHEQMLFKHSPWTSLHTNSGHSSKPTLLSVPRLPARCDAWLQPQLLLIKTLLNWPQSGLEMPLLDCLVPKAKLPSLYPSVRRSLWATASPSCCLTSSFNVSSWVAAINSCHCSSHLNAYYLQFLIEMQIQIIKSTCKNRMSLAIA